MVSDLDRYVGEVIDYLKKTGQYDNTFIFFCVRQRRASPGRRDLAKNIQDHVGKEYDHSLDNLGSATSATSCTAPDWASASATPFNRHKATAFEGGIHVPAFVSYPGKVARGSRSDAMGTVMDLLPTFLELAGMRHPGTSYRGREVLQPQGVSLLPVLYGKARAVHAADEVCRHRAVQLSQHPPGRLEAGVGPGTARRTSAAGSCSTSPATSRNSTTCRRASR